MHNNPNAVISAEIYLVARQSIQLGLTCRWSSEQEDIQSLQDNQPHFMTEVVPWRELDSENTNQNMYIEIESLEHILNKIE